MLMQWGAFQFRVPTYAVESMARKISTRVGSQKVVGTRPPTHLLGPDDETVTLESTFYPYHLNRGGFTQLAGVRAAVERQVPQMLIDGRGRIYGLWVATALDDKQEMFAPCGDAQVVTVSLSLQRYVGGLGFGGGIGAGLGGAFTFNLNLGGISASISPAGVSASAGIGGISASVSLGF